MEQALLTFQFDLKSYITDGNKNTKLEPSEAYHVSHSLTISAHVLHRYNLIFLPHLAFGTERGFPHSDRLKLYEKKSWLRTRSTLINSMDVRGFDEHKRLKTFHSYHEQPNQQP